jgi:hypothetical protein
LEANLDFKIKPALTKPVTRPSLALRVRLSQAERNPWIGAAGCFLIHRRERREFLLPEGEGEDEGPVGNL